MMTVLEVWYAGGGYEVHRFASGEGTGFDLPMQPGLNRDVIRIKVSTPLAGGGDDQK